MRREPALMTGTFEIPLLLFEIDTAPQVGAGSCDGPGIGIVAKYDKIVSGDEAIILECPDYFHDFWFSRYFETEKPYDGPEE